MKPVFSKESSITIL